MGVRKVSPKEIEIYDAVMIRSLIYDLGVRDPEKVISRLGLPPVSDEGRKVESERSELRLSRVLPATPLFARQATVIADVLGHEHADISRADGNEIDEESLIPVMLAYQSVSFQTIVAVLAYLLDAGVFRYAETNEDEEK